MCMGEFNYVCKNDKSLSIISERNLWSHGLETAIELALSTMYFVFL